MMFVFCDDGTVDVLDTEVCKHFTCFEFQFAFQQFN